MNDTQDIEQLVQKEYDARASLREAQEEYRLASLAVREKLGAVFAAKRTALGFSQPQCAALLGVVRQKVFSIECPDKVLNPFSIDSYLEMLRAIDALALIAPSIPKIKRGRIKGTKDKPKE